MACFVSHTTVNCRDAFALSRWWQQVLDYRDVPDDPNEPGHEECMIERADRGHRILFIETPDPASGANRIHLDLRPVTGSRDDEVERVAALGAVVVADRRLPDGGGWVVFADPEGNEFCVLRGTDELAGADHLTEVATFPALIGRP